MSITFGSEELTLLRALADVIPAAERLVTIENTLELGLDQFPEAHPDVVALEAREANTEGHGAISMAELIALAHDAIIIRTQANAIIFWNQGAERLYGWTEQEALGQVSHELLQTHFQCSIPICTKLWSQEFSS